MKRPRHLKPHPIAYAVEEEEIAGGVRLKKTLRDLSDFMDDREAVVQKNGVVRQAGAHPHQDAWVKGLKQRASQSLFIFCKSVLRCRWLTTALHLEACNFLQAREAVINDVRTAIYSKLLMFPRECGKTTIVGHGLPLHIHIQEPDDNVYFPGEYGRQQPIILAGETERRASDALWVIQDHAESNELLRALWPEAFWPGPPRQYTKKWNSTEMVLPRLPNQQLPDPSIRALGVGAAIAGAHPRVLIKDDLVTRDASNSQAIMLDAINWHVVSRALVNRPGCLEFIIGTHWAPFDLYSHIETHDNIQRGGRVHIFKKALIENGECIYPKFDVELNGRMTTFGFDDTKIEALKKEFGVLFPLMYMNNAFDPSLTDFSEDMIRYFTIEDGCICFDEDERDEAIRGLDQVVPIASTSHLRGQRLTPQNYDVLARRQTHLRGHAS